MKSYVCVFVSLNLTSKAFISYLHRFIYCCRCQSLLWSDHGTDFIGANRAIKGLIIHLLNSSPLTKKNGNLFQSILPLSVAFGNLLSKASKKLLRRVIGEVKLTFEEMYSILTQIEACLNSGLLLPVHNFDDDDIEVLTPGHFLIGQPLMVLPDPAMSYQSVSLLRCWHLCQTLVRHFWKRWSLEYLSTLQKISKRAHPFREISMGICSCPD